MPSPEERKRGAVQHQVLAYLLEHPAAKDTAAGIRVWWLRDESPAGCRVTEEALEALVELGWLLVYEAQGDRVYAFNPDHAGSIARFVNEGPEN